MKIVSWNVNGLRAIAAKNFAEAVRALAPDVLCLQETKAEPETVAEICSGLPAYQVYAHSGAKKGYSGTAMLCRAKPQSVEAGPESVPLGGEGRIQCADFGDFYLVNVYVPNSGQGLSRLGYRQEWDAAFCEYLSGLRIRKPLIVCGDLNVAHRPIDLKNDRANYNKTAGYTQEEIDGMDRLLGSGLLDIYRIRNPEQEIYTYWSYRFRARQRNIGWRIDYFLVSPELEGAVTEAAIYTALGGSDHCPIGLQIQA